MSQAPSKSQSLLIQELEATLTPDRISEAWFSSPHSVLLESSLGGRWTIAASEPSRVLIADGRSDFLETWRSAIEMQPKIDAPELPFAGGWIGYLSYELYDDILGKVASRPTALVPKAVMSFYDHFYLYDHKNRRAFIVSLVGESPGGGPPPGSVELARRLAAFFRDSPGGAQTRFAVPAAGSLPAQASPGASNVSKKDYVAKIGSIKNYIAAGDCYQVNLSQKFCAPANADAFRLYRRLREVSPSPYAAYLNLGDIQILSSSPESFLEVNGKNVITRPIKGTRPRAADAQEDARLQAELAASEKDRAELLMITDLERNDLGRVCTPGSIHVRDLRRVESYPQVHHLVSTIEGELAEGQGVVDLLKAAFPGGSITGAPKVRAMQIIRELEPHAREVYCGAIGYVSLNGKAQFNVAIRTMVVKGGTAHFWSGGGIVADSDPEKEYEETLVKAKGMMGALNS